MNKQAYFATIKQWEEIYGKPVFGAGRYNPADAKACCEKCGNARNKMSRHHKANDFFFALWFPNLYARRYIEFRREDTAKLCDKCHNNCERYYSKAKTKLYYEFNLYRATLMTDPEKASAWAEEWRGTFMKLFNNWISRPIGRKRKSRSTTKRKAD